MALHKAGGLHERVRFLISKHMGEVLKAVDATGGVAGIELQRMQFECADEVIAAVRSMPGMLWGAGNGGDDD